MTGDAGEGMTYLVATDVGGTCTDTIIFDSNGVFTIGKDLSTPPHFADGVLNSIRSAVDKLGLSLSDVLSRTRLFIHGSTVVDNAILTRDGTATGLLTTQGFEDTLQSTRGAYGRWAGLTEERIKHPVHTDRAAPITPRSNVVGIPGRIDSDGDEVISLDEEAVAKAVKALVDDKGLQAIAISFLWSFLNPDHERRARDIVKAAAPGTYVTLSSDIAPVPGEYERTSTAVINAYAGQITNDYLTSLQAQLADNGYRGATMVMQGYGGLLPAAEAADRAVGMIECGPAAGVIGAQYLGGLMGDKDVIAADMGGTTFKVGVVQDGKLEYAREPLVDRYHYLAPKIEVVSIGAGGGSIISLDPRTKVPRVGPRSAGATPGPICYGQGGEEPTLTDVMLLIGYMDPRQFLGGSITLDRDKTERIFREKIAEPLGMSVEEAAIGIYRIASAQITDLIREITVERGLDPRDFVLQSFGGTCGLLAAAFGQELTVKRVVIPYTASVNCAFGLITADVVHEYSTTTVLPASASAEEVNAIFAGMEAKGRAQLKEDGIDPEAMRMEWSVDLRYSRQVHEVTTPVEADTPLDAEGLKRLIDDFEALYERKFGRGSAFREAGIEMTMFRLTARGLMTRPEIPKRDLGDADASAALIETRDIFVELEGGMAPGRIYDFDKLVPGNTLPGPAVIHTPITTIAVPARTTAQMDAWSNIVVTFDG